MKFSCTKDNLAQGLGVVGHLGNKQTNLPILNNILIQAEVGGIRLVATNLEVTARCLIRGKVDQVGEFTVPAKLFSEYVNLLPDERIDIDLLDQAISIKCAGSKTKINGLPATEFPVLPPITGGVKYFFKARSILVTLNKTLFAVATSEARQALTGVLLKIGAGGKKGNLVATDSYRLAETGLSLRADNGNESSVLIPGRTAAEIRRVLGVLGDKLDADTEIEVEIVENQVAVKCGFVELYSRTLEGIFPDYQLIIPKSFKTEIKVKRSELIQAIRRTSLFSKTGLFDIKFEVKNVDLNDSGAVDATTGEKPKAEPDDGSVGGVVGLIERELVLSAQDSGRGENLVTMKAEIVGELNNITMNYRYLLEGLGAFSSEMVTLKLIDGGSPCLVVAEGEEYLHIIMPIRQN